MQENLSIEGVLLQTRRVVAARWPGLLAVAVVWGLVAWQAHERAMGLVMGGLSEPNELLIYAIALSDSVIGALGAAAMIAVVARTGLPRRSIGEMARHLAIAAATVAVALIVYGWVGMWLGEIFVGLARVEGVMTTPMGYAASFVPAIYQFALFAVFGMMLPAAAERPVAPWTAAAVSRKLTRGRRLWLVVIAVVWSAAAVAPMLALPMLAPGSQGLGKPLLALGQMLTAVGIGVLYLELRRLRTAVGPGPTAETFA